MTELFKNMRAAGYVIVLILAVTVLGIAAHLGSIFLPNLHRDFSIFSLVVSSLTILAFLLLYVLHAPLSPNARPPFQRMSYSRPWMEATTLFILGVLWLALGAWDADIMGSTQCDSLTNQQTPTKSGSISTRAYCYEMRVIEAFSWMLFALFVIFLWIVITLTSRAQAMGRPYAWSEPIFELPWFGQYPGMPESGYGSPGQHYAYPAGSPQMGYPGFQPGMQQGYQPGMVNGGYVVSQQPGHSVVIQPGRGGQAPTITQVPGMVTSA